MKLILFSSFAIIIIAINEATTRKQSLNEKLQNCDASLNFVFEKVNVLGLSFLCPLWKFKVESLADARRRLLLSKNNWDLLFKFFLLSIQSYSKFVFFFRCKVIHFYHSIVVSVPPGIDYIFGTYTDIQTGAKVLYWTGWIIPACGDNKLRNMCCTLGMWNVLSLI